MLFPKEVVGCSSACGGGLISFPISIWTRLWESSSSPYALAAFLMRSYWCSSWHSLGAWKSEFQPSFLQFEYFIYRAMPASTSWVPAIKTWVTIPLLVSISQMLETIIVGTAIYSTERKRRFIGVCISGDLILFHLKLRRRCKNGNNRQQYRPSPTLYRIETSSTWAVWEETMATLFHLSMPFRCKPMEKNYGVRCRKQWDVKDEIMRHYLCNPK